MKRYLFLACVSLVLIACNKTPEHEETESPIARNQSLPMDTLFCRIGGALDDPQRSFLEVKDEIQMLIDSFLVVVETSDDEDSRILTKDISMNMAAQMLFNSHITNEEFKYYTDSLAMRFSDILATWYCPSYTVDMNSSDRLWIPVMTQTHVFYDHKEDTESHVIIFELMILPDGKEKMIITLPGDAAELTYIRFNDEGFENVVELYMDQNDAEDIVDMGDGIMLSFGQELIDAMLLYDGLFISYYDDADYREPKERLHTAHMVMNKFQEQHKKLNLQQ